MPTDPSYANPAHNLARKLASQTSTHAEWQKGMAAVLDARGIPKEQQQTILDQLYPASYSDKIHRLKAVGAIQQQDAANAAKDAYTSEEPVTNGGPLQEFARKASIGLTGGADIKRSIHGLGMLGATGGQALAAAASGGLSIPAALVLNAAGGGAGMAAGGAIADKAGEELVNRAVRRDVSTAPAVPIKDPRVAATVAAKPDAKELPVGKVQAEYQPGSDFVGGALGSLLGAGLSGLGGAIRSVMGEAPVEMGAGVLSGLKGYLGVKGSQVNPADQAALKALDPEDKLPLFEGHNPREPGTSAMIVPPRVRTPAITGQRNVGLEALNQARGTFDKASEGLVEGATKRQAAEKALEDAITAKTAAKRAYDRLLGRRDTLVDQSRDLGADAPEAAAKLQQIKDAHANTVNERTKAQSAEQSEFEKWMRTEDAKDATRGQLGATQSRVAQAEAAAPQAAADLQRVKDTHAATTRVRAAAEAGEKAATEKWMGAEDAKDANLDQLHGLARRETAAFDKAPEQLADLERQRQTLAVAQTDADALPVDDLTNPATQALKLERQQLEAALRSMQSRVLSTGSLVDDLGAKSEVASKAAQRAADQTTAAARLPDLTDPALQGQRLRSEGQLKNLEALRGRQTSVDAKVDDLGVQSEVASRAAQRAADRAAAAGKGPTLADPAVQAERLSNEERLRQLEYIRGRIHESDRALDTHFDELSEAAAQEARAKQLAGDAAKAHDPQAAMQAEEVLRRKRMALKQFAPAPAETPVIEGGMSGKGMRHMVRDIFGGKAFPTSDLGGIRAESPEMTDLRATGRLFDTDRFPSGPAQPPTYGPEKPVSDIFSNPGPSGVEQRGGNRLAGDEFAEWLRQRRIAP